MISPTNDILTQDERLCLKKGLVFPELTKRRLSKIEFRIPKNELKNLLINIKEYQGLTVTLNNSYDLKLQYHGRFRSFLIGFGTNPENPYQPNLKLVRIETHLENTHNNATMAFLTETKIKGPHFHWYNSFYQLFIHNSVNTKKPSSNLYDNLVKKILDDNKNLNLNSIILKEAVPYNIFLKLHKLVIQNKKILREDGYITTNKKLSKNPEEVLNQILSKELF